MGDQTQKLDLWAVVELFGHAKIAGRCTEQNIAGTNMLRVDVPETKGAPAFTKFYGGSAIYAINPVDEQTARVMAERIEAAPINAYDMSAVMKKHQQQLALQAAEPRDLDAEYNATQDELDEDEYELRTRG